MYLIFDNNKFNYFFPLIVRNSVPDASLFSVMEAAEKSGHDITQYKISQQYSRDSLALTPLKPSYMTSDIIHRSVTLCVCSVKRF